MKIAILDDYQQAVKQLNCFKLIENYPFTILDKTYKDEAELAELISDATILVLIRERTQITEELLSRLPHLKLISQTGKISNHLDLNLCSKYNIAVAEGIGSPTAPSELTWNLIMDASRKIPQAIKAMEEGKWQVNIGKTIAGQTIGIWGYGKIGQQIAQYAKVFGANIQVWGSENSREKAITDGFNASKSKEDFFRTSDIISLHLRLNESTRGIVTYDDLIQMKSDAILVNTARAELIQKNALIDALNFGAPGLAALDVFEEEPILDINNSYIKHPKVICTPHLGYVEKNSYELYFSSAFENVLNYINGNPSNIANPEILK